jgi:hypothetical protein
VATSEDIIRNTVPIPSFIRSKFSSQQNPTTKLYSNQKLEHHTFTSPIYVEGGVQNRRPSLLFFVILVLVCKNTYCTLVGYGTILLYNVPESHFGNDSS